MLGSLCRIKETEEKGICIDHDIQKGDHLIYWNHDALWPVQVHAICIASRKESISIIDLGLTSSSPDKENKKLSDEQLKHSQGRSRIQIRVIPSNKELQKWEKVNYGKKADPSFWELWESKKDSKEKKKQNKNDEEDDNDDKTVSTVSSDYSSLSNRFFSLYDDEKKDFSFNNEEKDGDKADNEMKEIEDDNENFVIPPSDPSKLVLARVRYILSHPQVLPPHNTFDSNSECIAVWCKTGRWSTLQAAIFLHSTATSTMMLTATAASATATIATTVPAWGPFGWAGIATTKTAIATYLLLHPWVVPLIATYRVVSIGAPYLMLRNAKERWEITTQQLTDGFWNWAGPDIYVEAIQSWSNVRCC